jgi:hypothetical protein
VESWRVFVRGLAKVECLQRLRGRRMFDSESERSRSTVTIVIVVVIVLAILLGATWLFTS